MAPLPKSGRSLNLPSLLSRETGSFRQLNDAPPFGHAFAPVLRLAYYPAVRKHLAYLEPVVGAVLGFILIYVYIAS